MEKTVIIALIVFLLLGYVYTENPDIMNEIKSSISTQSGSECEDLAKELFPEFKLRTEPIGGLGYWELGNDVWKDGTGIVGETTYLHYYKTGSSQGQNINFYYPTGFGAFPFDPLTYSKKIISQDGTVLGTRSFSIRPVLKPIDGVEYIEEWKFVEFTYMYFEVVEPTFVSCYWLTDEGKVIR